MLLIYCGDCIVLNDLAVATLLNQLQLLWSQIKNLQFLNQKKNNLAVANCNVTFCAILKYSTKNLNAHLNLSLCITQMFI